MGAKVMARVALLAGSLLLTLVLLEAGARVYLHHVADSEAFLRYASLRDLDATRLAASRTGSSRRYSPHRYLGYYPTPGYEEDGNRHNSLGFRGDEIAVPKPAGEFRIACLGGWTTYTGGVKDYRRAYPQLLEAELRSRGYRSVRVVNAGAESYASWESLVNLEFRVLDLEPDLIIDYDGINDVHARLVWPPGAQHGDNSGRRAPNAASIVMPSVFEYSTLLRILLVRQGLMTPHADLARTIDAPAASWYGQEFWDQWRRSRYPSRIFKEVSAEAMLAANPPVYFKRNLESIVAVAAAHGARTVLATFAYSPNYRPGDASVSSRAYIQGIAEMNETMKAVARETGAHLFDLAAVFPKGRRLFADGEHVNFRGAKLMAKMFADDLIANRLVPEVGVPATGGDEQLPASLPGGTTTRQGSEASPAQR